MSLNFSDLNKGMVIELENQPWQVMDYERHKMQQRAPVTRIKMRNLISGAVIERTFQRYDTAFSLAESMLGTRNTCIPTVRTISLWIRKPSINTN